MPEIKSKIEELIKDVLDNKSLLDDLPADFINGNTISSGSITANQIADLTITAAEIANATITGAKIAAATITGSNLVNGTITATQIANATITATQIANLTITASQIANNTITATQIENNTITATQIANTTITASQIANLTITADQIANTTITSGKLSVSQLSAITADLGTITAGTVTGATLQTASGATSGIKMDTTSLRGYDGANNISFQLDPSTGVITAKNVVLSENIQMIGGSSNKSFFIGGLGDGMTNATVATGAVYRGMSNTALNMPATSDAASISAPFGVLDINFGSGVNFTFVAQVKTSTTTNQRILFGLNDDFTSYPSNAGVYTRRHIAFIIDDGILYASCGDGTTQSRTDVSSGITLTDYNTYKIITTGTTNAKFYINDTLVETLTTNLPSGSNVYGGFEMMSDDATVRLLYIKHPFSILKDN